LLEAMRAGAESSSILKLIETFYENLVGE